MPWYDLFEKGYAPNVGRSGSDTATTDFTSGKAAMMVGSSASLKQVLEDSGGKFEVGTAYYPQSAQMTKAEFLSEALSVGTEQ